MKTKRMIMYFGIIILLFVLSSGYVFAEENYSVSGEVGNLKSTFNYESSKIEKSVNISVDDSTKFGGDL